MDSPRTEKKITAAPACSFCGSSCPAPIHAERAFCCHGCRIAYQLRNETPAKPNDPSRTTIIRNLVISAFLGVNSMSLNLGYNAEYTTEPSLRYLGFISFLSSVIVLILLGKPLAREAWQRLLARSISIELLFVLGIGATFMLSTMDLVFKSGPIYFETTSILLVVYTIGKTIGARIRFKALEEAQALTDTVSPKYQKIHADGSRKDVPSSQIARDDVIVIAPGEVIPADGKILQGLSHVSEMMFTGEPIPALRKQGHRVFQGTRVHDGELAVRVLANGNETRLHRLLAEVQKTMDLPTPWQTDADRLVAWFLPAVLVTAFGTFGYWWSHADFMTGLMNALSVILVACPCAMGLATPIALWAGFGAFTRLGFAIIDPTAIQRLSGVTVIIFDKTGTLTGAECEAVDFVPSLSDNSLPTYTRARILALIRSIERYSDHPYAKSLRAIPLESEEELTRFSVTQVTPLPGIGISATVEMDGQRLAVSIGNDGLLSSRPSVEINPPESSSARKTLFVKIGNELIGSVYLHERPKQDLQQLFARLGLPIEIFTCDPSPHPSLFKVPVRSGLTPSDKSKAILELQDNGQRVLFVGDGVNDTPAMSVATVSIALNSGAEPAKHVASLNFAGQNLEVIATAIDCSRRIGQAIRANLVWALIYNVAGILLAAFGMITPVIAAVLMTCSSLLVALRAHRLHVRLVPQDTGLRSLPMPQAAQR
ncbi:MAG TPA: heavy metal translocating P-type ATPase [Bdellovibrionota bacterium]|nr:heavy metal translocating P-type ATPase [Bdellovibrionota bacterium]